MFKRGYLDDGASDLDSEACPGIARGHSIFPEQGLPIPRRRFLGVGWRRVTPEALGPRALGVGRWVFEREYPDDGTSNSNSETGSRIPQAHIRHPEEGWPIPRRRFLGVGC